MMAHVTYAAAPQMMYQAATQVQYEVASITYAAPPVTYAATPMVPFEARTSIDSGPSVEGDRPRSRRL